MPLELDLRLARRLRRVRDSREPREVAAERSAGERAVQAARIAPYSTAAAPAFLATR